MGHKTTVLPAAGAATYDLQDAKTKIQRVFRYLLELYRVKTPPVVHLNSYPWTLDLETLPVHPSIRRAHEVDEAGCVLKIGRSRETDCPQPSVMIQNWLKPGWNRVDSDAVPYETRTLKAGGGDGIEELFEDSEDRVDAFNDWLERRNEWARQERGAVDSLGVFSDLFELWGRFVRESEKFQLFLADGILVTQHEGMDVRHPVLLQRVQLDFDPLGPEFSVRETAEDPEIFSPLLRFLGVDSKDLLHVREALAAGTYHPLDREPTSEFLKDLVHRFWQDGRYFENKNLVGDATGPYLYRHPMVVLGHRNHGFAETLERYIDAVDGFTELPESLLRIVGIDTGRGADPDDDTQTDVDLLLTKDANPEQERVIRRLEGAGAVLVQGPPGTGKSHTIANLIGHLLAQKKTILVTSHASKALRVVREKVAEPLQALCVSLLDSDDESSKQLEESITGIVNYLSTTSEKKLEKSTAKLAERRAELKREHDDLRQALVDATTAEYRGIEVAGETRTPADMARGLREGKGSHAWIPGPVGPGTDLPLPEAELRELYALNAKIPADDEKMLHAPLPDPAQLPEPRVFAALFDEITKLESANLKVGAEYWRHENQTANTIDTLIREVEAAARVFDTDEAWLLDCIEAGRTGKQDRDAWVELAGIIDNCAEAVPPLEELVRRHGPTATHERPAEETMRLCERIADQLDAGKVLEEILEAQQIESARVDSGQPTTAEHFRAIRNHLEIEALRGELARRWDRQMDGLGAPAAAELGAKPEKQAKAYADRIRNALDWYRNVWAECLKALEHAGLRWDRLQRENPAPAGAYGDLKALRTLLLEKLAPLLATRTRVAQLQGLKQQRESWQAYLTGFPKKHASYPVVKLFLHGLKRKNFDSYSLAWRRLQELISLKPDWERRWELLHRLEENAIAWAHDIHERRAPHDTAEVPGDVVAAWRYRHWEQALDAQKGADLDALQARLSEVKAKLHEITADYVEKLAWASQLGRTGLEQQQALNGWLALHKKMGRGTGKRVGRLKQEAKKSLAKCRKAVPVWIMPLNRVLESFDIATTRFDVVILDEASQNDVMGLVALAMGKEAVVVGDHEQVSPYAVGHNTEKIQGLIDEILEDIPNRQLYDGKTSVYDLARQSFGGTTRLLEHFRCVPDIIQFSNFLCYSGEIRCLREASASSLDPHVVCHRVEGGQAINKINKREALEVVSLVCALCRLPEYEECTIGVISMVGTEQALYIDSILRRRLTVAEYQRRRLLCGNASQFQGDERDVIFLSMVDSPKNKPLTLRSRGDAKKVFNVAASRARDQLWVVHSLEPGRDLKPGDLRLQLLSHAADPTSLRADEPKADPERVPTGFEKAVQADLAEAGFRTWLHWQVGDFTVDLVVESGTGKRVALLCEGDRSDPPEELAEAMERQVILERLGWKFFRLRASEYFRDPAAAQKQLFERLKAAGIDRAGPAVVADAQAAASGAPSLQEKLLKRAEMIRSRWKEGAEEQAPPPPPEEC